MDETTTLKSGKELKMGVAPFSVANKLRKIVLNELKSVEVEIQTLDLREFLAQDINSIKDVICQLLGSDALEAAVFECMARCTLDGQKITKDTFEPKDARGDFLPCVWEVSKMNLVPFLEGLEFKSSALKEEVPSGPQ